MSLALYLDSLTRYACVDSAVLRAALRLNLFNHMGEGTIQVSQLAKRIGAPLRGVRLMTEVLIGSEVMIADAQGGITLNPAFIGSLQDPAFVELLYQSCLWWEPVRQLSTSVRTGTPVQHNDLAWDLLGHYSELFLTQSPLVFTVNEAKVLFDRVARNFLRTGILICSAEMRLFHFLNNGAISLTQLANIVMAPIYGLKVLMDVLVQMGILQTNGDVYYYCPEAQRILNRRTIEAYVQGWNLVSLYWEALGRLDEVVLYDKRILDLQDREQSSHFYLTLAKYTAITFPLSFRFTRRVAATIAQGRSLAHTAILDVGTGSGIWGGGFASMEPTAEVLFLDQPQILSETQRNIERVKLTGQAHFWSGNLLQVNYGEATFDVIILGEICHTQHPQDIPLLFEHLAHALRPGGVLVISDDVLNDQRDGPLNSLYFAIREFVSTQGEVFSLREYNALLSNVGLKALRCYSGPNTTIILASQKDIPFPECLLTSIPSRS